MGTVKRILIANRGEIAARIAGTARRMGLTPLIAYSEADRESLAVLVAPSNEKIFIGPARATDSYLNTQVILSAAKTHAADAIHPGYGFLSENSAFAREVQKQGLVWIGPGPDAMDMVSSKSKAKQLAENSKVPILPGFQGEQNPERFAQEAQRIGYPVLLKASAGGGGRGIRRVENAQELKAQFPLATSEALNSFGDGELLLEKYIGQSRHIEVQIFGDGKGQVVHLGERDCSVQRRHQKLIEESPSPAVTPELREQMTAAAVRLGQACGYAGAGTVEFLLTPSGDFYFLEVNARLQVEHPVTEMVTGLDLVEWQIRIARGEGLPLSQKEIQFRGHSIQLRLYAEDPYRNYEPQTGKIEAFTFPLKTRVDHFLTSRTEITPYYDSMLAKIIVHGTSRTEALKLAEEDLNQTLVSGPVTNQIFLKQILTSDFFRQGQALTQTLDSTSFEKPHKAPLNEALTAASLAEFLQAQKSAPTPLDGWSNGPQHHASFLWHSDDNSHLLRVARKSDQLTVTTAAGQASYANVEWTPPWLLINSPEKKSQAIVHRLSHGNDVLMNGEIFSFRNGLSRSSAKRGIESNAVTAPMSGTIQQVACVAGSQVKAGDVLAVLEAMKMQVELRASRDAVIESVLVQPGSQVRGRQILLKLQPTSAKEN